MYSVAVGPADFLSVLGLYRVWKIVAFKVSRPGIRPWSWKSAEIYYGVLEFLLRLIVYDHSAK